MESRNGRTTNSEREKGNCGGDHVDSIINAQLESCHKNPQRVDCQILASLGLAICSALITATEVHRPAGTHLGKGSQAVGGAAGVGDDVEVSGVLVLVHTNHEHAERGEEKKQPQIRPAP